MPPFNGHWEPEREVVVLHQGLGHTTECVLACLCEDEHTAPAAGAHEPGPEHVRKRQDRVNDPIQLRGACAVEA